MLTDENHPAKMKSQLLGGMFTFLVATLVACNSSQGVMVQEVGIGAHQTVEIQVRELSPAPVYVYAGVVDLKVNGQAQSGFCIDPFHWSSGQALADYNYASLADTTAIQSKPGIQLNGTQATVLSRLWSTYYNAALTNDEVAAGLQIAIWELVATSDFSLVGGSPDYGARDMLSAVQSGSYHADNASLIALRGPINGQDYVVQVPDGGATILLLGLSLSVFVGLSRFFKMMENAARA